jgi:hypothetical protein
MSPFTPLERALQVLDLGRLPSAECALRLSVLCFSLRGRLICCWLASGLRSWWNSVGPAGWAPTSGGGALLILRRGHGGDGSRSGCGLLWHECCIRSILTCNSVHGVGSREMDRMTLTEAGASYQPQQSRLRQHSLHRRRHDKLNRRHSPQTGRARGRKSGCNLRRVLEGCLAESAGGCWAEADVGESAGDCDLD